jgi:probable selenium-dependent hydroxylase accessory protein YqeC
VSNALLDAFNAHAGIVCAVGAGGKKTSLYALAAAHPGRVGYTATVFTARFPRRLNAHERITEAGDLPEQLAALREHPRIAYARPTPKSGRVAGVEPGLIGACHERGDFDLTLVKADGARMRAIKAPAAGEPVLPPAATTVLIVASAAAIGQPVDERIAHRPERLARVTGVEPGASLSAAAVGRLLAADDGGLQGIPPGATAIAVINAVDDATLRARAASAAQTALAATPRLERVVLTRHRGERDPVVTRIERAF